MSIYSTPPPMPLPFLTSELKESLQSRWISLLDQIITKNTESIYFKNAPLLAEFRLARSSGSTGSEHNKRSDNDNNTDTFLLHDSLVPFSTYKDYYPYVSRLLTDQSQCPPNLLSPGLPIFIAHTSGTTGAHKNFPKYPHPVYTPRDTTAKLTCKLTSFRYYGTVSVQDGNDTKEIPICPFSIGLQRTKASMSLKDDEMIKSRKGAFWNTFN